MAHAKMAIPKNGQGPALGASPWTAPSDLDVGFDDGLFINVVKEVPQQFRA